MFIAYSDESGYTGGEPDPKQRVFSLASVVANIFHLHRSVAVFADLIGLLQEHGLSISELKGKDLYEGVGSWSGVPGEARHRLYEDVLRWLAERPHKLFVTVLRNDDFFGLRDSGHDLVRALRAPYVCGALHLALTVQRHLAQGHRKDRTKAKTILVFDRQKQYERVLADTLYDPPCFTDDFYGRDADMPRLDLIMDTSYFVDSTHGTFVQLADMLAYVARRRAEFEWYHDAEDFSGQVEELDGWWSIIQDALIARRHRYPRSGGEFAKFLSGLAPQFLKR